MLGPGGLTSHSLPALQNASLQLSQSALDLQAVAPISLMRSTTDLSDTMSVLGRPTSAADDQVILTPSSCLLYKRKKQDFRSSNE